MQTSLDADQPDVGATTRKAKHLTLTGPFRGQVAEARYSQSVSKRALDPSRWVVQLSVLCWLIVHQVETIGFSGCTFRVDRLA